MDTLLYYLCLQMFWEICFPERITSTLGLKCWQQPEKQHTGYLFTDPSVGARVACSTVHNTKHTPTDPVR